MTITARYVEAHYNPTTRCMIPEYWTPNIDCFEMMSSIYPCRTEQEAIELGTELVEEGLAEAY